MPQVSWGMSGFLKSRLPSSLKSIKAPFQENFRLQHESLSIVPQDSSCRVPHAILSIEERKGDWNNSTHGLASHLSKVDINSGRCPSENIFGKVISKIGFNPDGRIQNLITEPVKSFIEHEKPVELDVHLDCALSQFSESLALNYFGYGAILFSVGGIAFMNSKSIDKDALLEIDKQAEVMFHSITSKSDVYLKDYTMWDLSKSESIIRGEVQALRQHEFVTLFHDRILKLTESYREA
jgi:hypothetical protein